MTLNATLGGANAANFRQVNMDLGTNSVNEPNSPIFTSAPSHILVLNHLAGFLSQSNSQVLNSIP